MPKGEYLQYGGQAIIEGVMMRSPNYFSVACRAPNGEIITKTEHIEKTWIGRQKWLKLPFLRGSLALLDSMALGIKSMKFSSDVQMNPAYQPNDGATDEKPLDKRVQDIAIGATIVVSLAMGLFIFNYLPNLISENLKRLGTDPTLINFVTETIKVIFFLGYVAAIGQLKDIKEVFKYHGAEHKAINTMEANEELNLENCSRQTRLHPRCGTSFAIIVLIVSMLVFTFVPRYLLVGEDAHFILRVSTRFVVELMILPFIAGIAYELIRFAGKFKRAEFVQMLFAPGLMSQYLTTREPNEGQIEVALTALKACVEAEENGLEEEPEDEAEPVLS